MGRFHRFTDTAALRAYLEQQEYPRLQMMLFVSASGLAGFLADWSLLHLGLESMMWRYGLAVLVAYLPFLALLRVWVGSQGVQTDGASLLVPDGEDVVDGLDLGSDFVADGGASPRAGLVDTGFSLPSSGGSGGGGSLDLDLGGDLDEAVLVVILIAAVVGLVMAVGYLVWQAPAIFAELLLDGALSAGLYRRLRSVERSSFLGTAFRKTFAPFAVMALLLGAAGWGLQAYAPSERTLRGVWAVWQERHL